MQEPSGDYYDWTITKQPERPWMHHYDQTLTMKMYLASKLDGGTVALTFAQALEVIRKIDNLTCEAPKIIYLVGWQYDGHDSKCPAMDEVNERLKRPEDATALDSLKWLMREARQYHTTVGLHINMLDAYPNSPLWDAYVAADVIAKDAAGELVRGHIWDGEQCYLLSYTREWETGLAQQRIDRLCEMLPIAEAGTIHIDAFHSCSKDLEPFSPGHGISAEQEAATQRKMFRYLRDKGIDVTSEFTSGHRIDPFVGFQPMTWHFKQEAKDYLARPASLYCGGGTGSDLGKIFGRSMHGEDLIQKDPKTLTHFLAQFCKRTMRFFFLNRLDRLGYADGVATFSENVTSDGLTVRQGDRVLVDGGDVCLPAAWRDGRELIAYSTDGYAEKTWEPPSDWRDVTEVKVVPITLDGLGEKTRLPVVDGKLTLSLSADQGVAITPV